MTTLSKLHETTTLLRSSKGVCSTVLQKQRRNVRHGGLWRRKSLVSSSIPSFQMLMCLLPHLSDKMLKKVLTISVSQLGRILHPQIAGSSMALTRALLQGNSGVMHMLWTRKLFLLILFFSITNDSNFIEWYVDVQDNAKLHIIALLGIEVKSERIFAFADIYTWTQIIELMHKILPEDRCRQLVSPPKNEGRALGKIIPAKRAEELLLS